MMPQGRLVTAILASTVFGFIPTMGIASNCNAPFITKTSTASTPEGTVSTQGYAFDSTTGFTLYIGANNQVGGSPVGANNVCTSFDVTTAPTSGTDTLYFRPTTNGGISNTVVSYVIGQSATAGIPQIILNGGTDDTVTFNGDINPTNGGTVLKFTVPTTAVLGDNVTIYGNVVKESICIECHFGTLEFVGNGKVTGIVGGMYEYQSISQIILKSAANTSSTVTFDQLVSASSISFSGSSGSSITANLNGNVIGDVYFASANTATTVLADGVSLTGTVYNTSGTNNIGEVKFLGSGTITGSIGAGTNGALSAVNLNGSSSAIVNLQGNTNAQSVNFGDDSTLQLNSDVTVTGDILNNSSTNDYGTVEFLGNGSVVGDMGSSAVTGALKEIKYEGGAGTTALLQGSIYASNTYLEGGGMLSVPTSQTITGALSISNASTLSLSNGANLSVDGPVTMDTGTTLHLDMGGKLINIGSLTSTAGISEIQTEVNLVIANPPKVSTSGTVIPIVSVEPGSALNPFKVQGSSFLHDFETVVNGDEIDLVINNISLVNPSAPPNVQGVAWAIDTMSDSGVTPTGELDAVLSQLGSFTTLSSLNEALASLAPIADDGMVMQSFNTQLNTFDAISERLSQVQASTHLSLHPSQGGYVAGDTASRQKDGWLKVFGQHAHQKTRDGIGGYKDDTWGLAIGTDTMMSDAALVGGTFSWSKLNIRNQETGAKTTANSYQLALYGQYDFSNPVYLNWMGGAAYNEYDTSRNIAFGNVIFNPQGDFHGIQFGAQAELGYDYAVNALHTIPLLSLFYSHLDVQGYTETGAGTANYSFDSQDYNMLLGGAGLRIAYDCDFNGTLFQPEIHALAYYDFINDRMATTSQFTGGGPSFGTAGIRPPHESYNLGASITTYEKGDIAITASYDFDFMNDYTAHAGFLRVRYEW